MLNLSFGMEYRILSKICGRLYLPIFLIKVGLFILIFITFFMALAILCPTLTLILKFFH